MHASSTTRSRNSRIATTPWVPAALALATTLLVGFGCSPAESNATGGDVGHLLEGVPSLPEGSTEGLGFVSGELTAEAGKVVEREFTIDQNDVLQAQCMLSGDRCHFEIQDASGVTLEKKHEVSGEMAPTLQFSEFELHAPPAGKLVVKLAAGPDGPASLHTALFFGNGIRLMTRVQTPVPPVPECSVTVRSFLVDRNGALLSGGPKAWSLTVSPPEGEPLTLQLHDDGRHDDGAVGDGVFGNRLGATQTALTGQYGIHVRATSVIADQPVVRESVATFVVQSDDATFAGPAVIHTRDVDGDGLHDYLDFTYDLDFSKAGRYRVVGHLHDVNGNGIDRLSAKTDVVAASRRSVVLSVECAYLVKVGVAGPWTLRDVFLEDESDHSFLRARVPDAVAQGFALESFERPPAPKPISVSPDRGSAHGGDEIMVNGTDFYRTESVTIDGVEARFEFRDDRTLGVIVPRTRLTPPYPDYVALVVRTPFGSGELTRGYMYQ